MGRHLFTCPSCQRHIRASEVACPFCGQATTESFRAQVSRPRPIARLSRAALFSLTTTAAAAGTLVACVTAEEPTYQALYGGPPVDDDGGQGRTLYGGPAIDASMPDANDGGAVEDGGDAGDDAGDGGDGGDAGM